MTQPTLETSRLVLAPLADEHLELEVELDSDPEVMRHLGGYARSRVETEEAHKRRRRAGQKVPGLGFWVGFVHGEFVGWWILQPPRGPDQPDVDGEAELGYRLLRKFWRLGYAREGARELIRYGFAEVGLTRIFAQTLAVNRASRATMTSAGLTFAREFASSESIPGAEHGEVEYEITRDTYESVHVAGGTHSGRT
ncbi:GNAT family N-acetyltransferase [Aeromicrobium ginsengisoli]|uniref:GNAT family N-acetyltransferase n=1 Tax=Aeromicrobium ginsengisoli TaxID=363867 RepID=A0A5M4FHL6_9ACTN|nr:GNAT family N-acetyltransferase [Aeromicrobium ginsengisoli]KAA1399590.1 GNAT family N-acetyltransferase [Aeromicrobium ginsengisoli]